jgi:hypothetical protein
MILEQKSMMRSPCGQDGNGLNSRVTDVRIMDPTNPDGYVSYSNATGQPVHPYTGQTVAKSSPWWYTP